MIGFKAAFTLPMEEPKRHIAPITRRPEPPYHYEVESKSPFVIVLEAHSISATI